MGFSLKKIGKKIGSGFKSVAKGAVKGIAKGASKALNNKFTQKVIGKAPILGGAVKMGGGLAYLANKALNKKSTPKKKATSVVKPSLSRALQSSKEPMVSSSNGNQIFAEKQKDSIWNDVATETKKQVMLQGFKNWYNNNKVMFWCITGGVAALIALAIWYFKKRR